MAGNNMYKDHPYSHPTNDRRQLNNPNNQHEQMATYMNGAKYHNAVGQTIIDLSKTHGINIDGINGMK